MESLLKNSYQLKKIHNESDCSIWLEDEQHSDLTIEEKSDDSLGSITSGNEDDCATLFKGKHKYRFEAEEQIK